MYFFLVSLVWGVFAAMVFLNLYFRMKVMRAYGVLVKNRVEFKAEHVFNRKKMENEVYPRYPEQRQAIETFTNHLRYSIKMASVLIALVTVFGGILMYYRHLQIE